MIQFSKQNCNAFVKNTKKTFNFLINHEKLLFSLYNFRIFSKTKNMKKRKKKSILADKNDPLGAYTGVPIDGGQPQQDADDL